MHTRSSARASDEEEEVIKSTKKAKVDPPAKAIEKKKEATPKTKKNTKTNTDSQMNESVKQKDKPIANDASDVIVLEEKPNSIAKPRAEPRGKILDPKEQLQIDLDYARKFFFLILFSHDFFLNFFTI